MFTFLLVMVVSTFVLAGIATHDKIKSNNKIISAWGLGMFTIIVIERLM